MEKFVKLLRQDYPRFTFKKGKIASWSSKDQRIFYVLNDGASGLWALLHELGHALLGHKSYENDMELLGKEVEAWEKACSLARTYDLCVPKDYVESCLDTYRDWLHKRSLCPDCGNYGLQHSQDKYKCINCRNTWGVTNTRFCRPYRRSRT